MALRKLSAFKSPSLSARLSRKAKGTHMKQYCIAAMFALASLGACQSGALEETPATPPASAGPVSVKPVMANPQNFDEADQQACSDFGGNYVRAGLAGYYNCFVDYADGGKACSDVSDCQGRCMAKNAQAFDPDAQGGQTGTCQLTDSPFGCYAEIVNGVVQPGLCVD